MAEELDLQPVVKKKRALTGTPDDLLRPDEIDDISLMEESFPELDLRPVIAENPDDELLDLKPAEPSWVENVQKDWAETVKDKEGFEYAAVPGEFLARRFVRGVKEVGKSIEEHTGLIKKEQELRTKKQRGLASPEELESLDNLQKKRQEEAVEQALMFGPGPIIAGGRVGKIKDLFKEMWSRGEEKVPKKVLKKIDDFLDDYESKLLVKSSEGKPAHQAMQEVERDLSRLPSEIDDMLWLSGRELRYPSREEAVAAINMSRLATIESRERQAGNFIADVLKPISTRLKEMNEELFGALRKFEYKIRTGYHEGFSAGEPFLAKIEKLGSANQRTVKRALMQGDFDIVKRFIANDRQAMASFEKVQGVLKNILERQKAGGLKATEVKNYWPRGFTDTKKALKTLGVEDKSAVIKAFGIKRKQLGRELSDLEKSEVLHSTLFGRESASVAPGHLKARKYAKIPDKFLDLYGTPRQTLHYYLRDTILDLEKRAFLGKRLTRIKGTQSIDWDSSLLKVLKKDYKLMEDTTQFRELKKLLRARMLEGDASPSKIIQATRNITYSATLGNPLAAITQLQDIGLALQKFGVWNALKALAGKRNVRTMDFGLRDASIELLHSPSATARWMERFLKYSGFAKMDQFGKEIILNGALRKGWKLAQTEKGRNLIAKKWSKTLGDESTGKLLQDLKDKKMTEDVRLYLWNELSDIQPISLAEMPVKYLQAPNGRLFYALKSFTLRQLDLILNDTFRMIKKGQVRQGFKNLGGYAVFLSALGVGTDSLKKFITGQPVTVEDLPDAAVNNMLKIFGASEFLVSLGASGLAGSALTKVVTPAPISVLDSVGTDIVNVLTKDDVDIKSIQYVPIVGKFIYWWFGPGLERIAQKEKEKQKAE